VRSSSLGATRWPRAAPGGGIRPAAQLVRREEEEGGGTFAPGCVHVGEAEPGTGANSS
jgi:hypothetical protein